MVTTNIIQRDISEMEKNSIGKGTNVPLDRKRFGKLEFVVSICYIACQNQTIIITANVHVIELNEWSLYCLFAFFLTNIFFYFFSPLVCCMFAKK